LKAGTAANAVRLVVAVLVTVCAGWDLCAADNVADALRRSTGAIFADAHVVESAVGVHERAMSLSPEERYRFLSEWVLPNANHSSIRLHAGYTQTNPAGVLNSGELPDEARVPSGGRVVSPVLDLVDAAAELGLLDEVQRRVSEHEPVDAADERSALALLSLVELKRKRPAAALPHIDRLLELSFSDEFPVEGDHEAELLVCLRGIDFAEVREVLRGPAYRIHTSHRTIRPREAFHRHFASVAVRLTALADSAEQAVAEFSHDPGLKLWRPVSREVSRTRGKGYPTARWRLIEGGVENVASHENDHLYFGIPLQGDYEVECDLAAFAWRDTQLNVAGRWVMVRPNHQSITVGDLRDQTSFVEFAPPLTKIRNWAHFRVVVRGRTATMSVNGRPVYTVNAKESLDPWLSIHSNAHSDGGVRNIRITGSPTIPQTLKLTADEDLEGWMPWSDESIHSQGNWQPLGDAANGGGIRSGHRRDLPTDCYKESLLYYHRPMLEDGVIEYEFYYSEGEVEAHPALDRLAFLLRPDGVHTHWITDGKFDVTEHSGAATEWNSSWQRGTGPVPLQAYAWNRLRLSLAGHVVRLELNGQPIFERILEASNQRTFGVFHYADQTELLVRNVLWTGQWPDTLPAVADQELAGEGVKFLDERLPDLTAVFEHNFAEQGLPEEQFATIRGESGVHLVAEPAGLRAMREGTGGYQNATVAALLSVGGDFDIVAAYEQLEMRSAADRSCTVALLAITDGDRANEHLVMRRIRSFESGNDEQIVQCCSVVSLANGQRRSYPAHQPFEADTGKLRLARRGNRLYYLFSEGDTGTFRLLHSEEVVTDDLQPEGLRLMLQAHDTGSAASVVWKNLVIRAERLPGR
jgi:hypothetical protein